MAKHPIPFVLALLALPALGPVTAGQKPEPPPGLVRVPGTRTKIGTTVKDAEALIVANEGMRNTLAGETPQHSVQVADFFLMVSEVTNEQYLEFVRTMGAKPPENWAAEEPFEAARKAFSEETQAKKESAEADGRRFVRGPPLDRGAWWEEHWRETGWDAPADKLDHPVTYVNYQDARAYATWAGLRLMTEFEYQCAVRGKTRNLFPWGDDWDDKKYCASIHDGLDYALPIGSFPAGAVNGLFDLAGNVWEWTSSPYVPYPGNKVVTVTIGKGRQARKVQGMAQWDANKRVAVGGSAKNPKLACRCTTRRTTDRFQTTDSLGFRVAASMDAARDMAERVLEELEPRQDESDVGFLPNQAGILERWTSVVGRARNRAPRYEVIAGYDCILFVPAERASGGFEDQVIVLGILHTTVSVEEPKLAPGTYSVVRLGGSFVLGGSLEDLEGDSFVFADEDGEFVSVPAPPLRKASPLPTRIAYEPFSPFDVVTISTSLRSEKSRKAYVFDLELHLTPDVVDRTWRSRR